MIAVRIAEVLCLAVGGLALGYWAVLAVAASRKPRSPSRHGDAAAVAVLIPAHNEARVLGGLLGDLRKQETPPTAVLVVADRCTDATADIARGLGAEVLERTSGEGAKAEALAAGIAHAGRWPSWNVLLVLDADCRIPPGFIGAARVGPDAAWQTQVELRSEGPRERSVYAFWSRLENAVFHRGRARLGLPAFLRGTGMFLGRAALERCGWQSRGLTEDRAQGLFFLREGVPVRYLPGLSVFTVPPEGLVEGWKQRRRWSSAGLVRPLSDAARTALAARRGMGLRTLELPLAALADARSFWILLIVLAAVLAVVSGHVPWTALTLLLAMGTAAAAAGFSWYGRGFLGTLAKIPSSAIVAMGSAALGLLGQTPRGWRSRR
jgi:cellulose synthase/poly-beta-1,6-N-acetylglucosamine synthase-like glycosyltransferase